MSPSVNWFHLSILIDIVVDSSIILILHAWLFCTCIWGNIERNYERLMSNQIDSELWNDFFCELISFPLFQRFVEPISVVYWVALHTLDPSLPTLMLVYDWVGVEWVVVLIMLLLVEYWEGALWHTCMAWQYLQDTYSRWGWTSAFVHIVAFWVGGAQSLPRGDTALGVGSAGPTTYILLAAGHSKTPRGAVWLSADVEFPRGAV